MNCPKCGNELSPSMKFCAKCGTEVSPANCNQQPLEFSNGFEQFVPDNIKRISTQQTEQFIPQNIESNEKIQNKENRTKMMTVLIAVALAVVILVATIVIVVLLKDKNPENNLKENETSSIISQENIDMKEVPDFVGMIYDLQVFEDEYKDFCFYIEYKVDPNYDANEIISQNPVGGEKIDPVNQHIKLIIAVESEKIEIPSALVGEDYVYVKNILIKNNLKVTEEVVDYSKGNGAAPGTVIAVSPDEGSQIPVGSEVKITYVSNNSDNSELVKVPDVSNYTEGGAVTKLENSGFVVEVKYEYSNTIPQGYVIGTSISKGTEIPKGSYIVLTVSLGSSTEQTAEIKITLPNTGKYGQFAVSLDGTNILTKNNLLLNGSDYSFSVNGSGSDSQLKVFIDGKTIYKCEINFTTIPCTIRNESYYTFEAETTTQPSTDESLIVMPDVYMMSPDEAESSLVISGFKRENITRIGSGNVVISQFPVAGNSFPPDIKVEITLGDAG